MPAWLAPALGGALVAGGLFGSEGEGGNAALEAAIREFSGIRAPSAEEMMVELQKLVSTGRITPAQAEAIMMESSAWEGVEADPIAKAAQYKALAGLQGVSEEGITEIEQADIRRIQDELATTSRGDQGAIMESMRRMGKGGSGMELAGRMGASQAATTRASREGLDTAARARERSLQALMQTGQLSGQIRGQGYGEQAQKAQALDAIQRFNVTNRQSTQEQNIDRREQAQYYNLGEKQRTSDYNTMLENQNRLRDSDLKQQEFENKMSLAAGRSGQYATKGALEEERRKSDQAYNASLIGSGGQMLSSFR
jgi:hypothetical protein